MRFTELDDLARKDESPAERARHDRRRAELRAAPYAGIAIRDAREEAGLSKPSSPRASASPNQRCRASKPAERT